MDKASFVSTAETLFQQLQRTRRHLHQHPELSYEEHETAAFVAGALRDLGLDPKPIAETGILAEITGKDPGSRHFALRADMDALPITEQSKAPYTSKREGVMHACGHDVHTTSLIGAAHILKATRDQWSGTVRLLFQPGEEKLPGGATLMIRHRALENPAPAGIVGQHVFPELPAGTVGFKAGQYMASCDELHVVIKGKGGHGAMPHKNIDAVLIASHLVVALQQIVSRRANPEVPSVLSFGKFIAAGATNVIPPEVHLEGTFRTLDETWRAEAHEHMIRLAQSLVESMGGTVDFRVEKGYPSLFNDPTLTESCRKAAIDFLGEERVKPLQTRMTAEDFSYYTHHLPGCFYRLGTASPDGRNTFPVHHPAFDIDEQALVTGAGLMAWIAATQVNAPLR